MKSRRYILTLIGLVMAFLPVSMLEAQYTVTPIPDPPGSTNTFVVGISGTNLGGYYTDSSGVTHGFIYNRTANTSTPIPDPPGSIATQVTGISGTNLGGYYTDSFGFVHGFIYYGATNTSTPIPYPPNSYSIYVTGISGTNLGGYYTDSSGVPHGFIYNGTNNTTTPIPNPPGTIIFMDVTGISGTNLGGYYSDSSDVYHGFIYNGTTSTTTPIPDPPNSTATYVKGISGTNLGGFYYDPLGATHGFIYNGTTNTTTPIPDPPSSFAIYVSGISGTNLGGNYNSFSTGNVSHGFIYNGNNNTSTPIPDPPNNTAVNVTGISGTNLGGSYTDTSQVSHGFLATPTISMVMHRAVHGVTNSEGNQPSPDDNVDDALKPSTSSDILQNEPPISQGLVADGVTPLILELDGTSSTPVNYVLNDPGSGITGGTLSTNLQMHLLTNGQWSSTPIQFGTTPIPISSTQPAYLYIQGFKPEDITYTAGMTQLTATLTVQPAGGSGSNIELGAVGLRKPPIVLVHGYNVDPAEGVNGWAASFVDVLYTLYGSDFVQPITYDFGKKSINTTYDLGTLAQYLSNTLSASSGVEDLVKGPFAGWAMTRYDLVGHSQGGVLARMLCTTSKVAPHAQHTPFGTLPFSSSANFYRGRFRRIITIGSPHNGSRLVYYLSNLKNSDNVWYQSLPSFLGAVLQDKFDPFGSQIQAINDPSLQVDPGAKFHLISTEIADGQVPGVSFPSAYPLCYEVAGLCSDVTGQAYTRGQIVLGGIGGPPPFANPDNADGGGSDGVVDVVSQQGGTGNGSILTFYTSEDVAHADVGYLFAVPSGQSDTSYPAMATTVSDLLNGNGNGIFGSFTLPVLLNANAQTAIDDVSPQLSTLGLIVQNAITDISVHKATATTATTTSYSFTLTPDSSEPLQGTVNWYAEVYAPGGVTSNGVTVSVNASDSTQVTVSVDSSVVGDVVLKAIYTATTGHMVAPAPIIVVSIPSTATQTGISLSPSPDHVIAGETSVLELDKVYNDGTSQPAFLNAAAPVQFGSSNTNLLTVDHYGTIHPLAAGQVMVTASYGGFTTQDTVTIVAPGLGPQITSPATAYGSVNAPFSYQITALQNPTNFGATGSLDGLSIDPTSGLISGTPTAAGTFTVTTTAANASNQDTNTLTLVIAPAATPTSFTNWENGFSFAGAATATPEGDGVPNLLKYLFDINPTGPMSSTDRAALPAIGTDTATNPGTTYLTLTYRQYAGLAGVTVNFQTSPDLRTWTTITPDINQEIGTDPNTGDPIMEVGVIATGTKQFIRLNVTQP